MKSTTKVNLEYNRFGSKKEGYIYYTKIDPILVNLDDTDTVFLMRGAKETFYEVSNTFSNTVLATYNRYICYHTIKFISLDKDIHIALLIIPLPDREQY